MENDKGILVREAIADDAELLHKLICALARYDDMEQENESTVEAVRTELASENGVLEALIAEINGVPVGMVTYIRSFATFANKRGIYLEDIFVEEDYRHQGVGTALMQFLTQIAIDRNYGRIGWMTMVWNTDAMDFYAYLGSRPNDEWTAFRENREWIDTVAKRFA